ncbi:MAG: HlyD family type I secretion periplasmic adaptor subunit [Magnetococcales bacterium]|nr:HlyD family type I secretion periplasmic adaptor subunit [Magnetococcales bacterium]
MDSSKAREKPASEGPTTAPVEAATKKPRKGGLSIKIGQKRPSAQKKEAQSTTQQPTTPAPATPKPQPKPTTPAPAATKPPPKPTSTPQQPEQKTAEVVNREVKAAEEKKEEAKRPKFIPATGEPLSLLSLLEPDPEEVTKLKQGAKLDRFLSQSVILEESGLSTLVRASILLVAMVLTVFLIWASHSTIDEMASTTGQVIPNSPIQVIQHLEGGIIEQIYIQEGQIVKKGGLIARLSPKSAQAELNQMRARQASLTAQKIRLTALIEGVNADFSSLSGEYDNIVLGQVRLLNAQRVNFENQIDVYQTRIERIEARLENLLDQQASLNKQVAFTQQEMTVREQGYAKGLMSRLTVISAQRDKTRVESELVRIIGQIAGARKDLSEATSELDGLVDTTREDSYRELSAITGELSQITEGMARLKDRVARLLVYSPVWGIVKGLQVETIGGVLIPGSVITDIIPLDATRRVETKISTRDVGHVRIGQGVTVKVTTFDFARYGGISGILESISPTTFSDPSGGEAFYKGIVRLEKSYVGGDPNSNQVLPGMTVQADIHTGAKTLMEYLLKPIYASVNKSFRER